MGLFGDIMAKLGLGGEEAPAPAPTPAPPAAPAAPEAPRKHMAPPLPKPKAAMPMVDVVAQLEERAANNAQKLNWRTSIVDLLKLLELDSSYSARKELAAELECPAELMEDSAQMNMWLHKTVLARIAANGGNVPASLLD